MTKATISVTNTTTVFDILFKWPALSEVSTLDHIREMPQKWITVKCLDKTCFHRPDVFSVIQQTATKY